MRVLMTGGGTAGHVNPAIAIANTIKKYEKDSTFAFVCSSLPRDKALDLVPRAGYDTLYSVDIRPSYAIWNPKNILTLYSMIRSKGQAKEIIRKFDPDVIIGTGGFACYPVLNAGAELGIPTVVHESNAIPGRAVLKLANKIDCVMTNFESTSDMIPKAREIVNVGNPAVVGQDKDMNAGFESDGYKKHVLSFGGSLGAETLNRAMCSALCLLADKHKDTEFYHAAGKRDYEALREEFSKCGLLDKKNVVLVDYIYDMDRRMARADLIISRAGAMTLSELALLGKAAVLVPSPYVAANHQFKNAKAIADKGGCVLVEEADFNSGLLGMSVDELLVDGAKRESLSREIKKLAKPDANRIIYEEIKRVIEKGKRINK